MNEGRSTDVHVGASVQGHPVTLGVLPGAGEGVEVAPPFENVLKYQGGSWLFCTHQLLEYKSVSQVPFFIH